MSRCNSSCAREPSAKGCTADEEAPRFGESERSAPQDSSSVFEKTFVRRGIDDENQSLQRHGIEQLLDLKDTTGAVCREASKIHQHHVGAVGARLNKIHLPVRAIGVSPDHAGDSRFPPGPAIAALAYLMLAASFLTLIVSTILLWLRKSNGNLLIRF